MKHTLLKQLYLLTLFLSISFCASAQVYVQTRPVVPAKFKTEILAKGYTYVDEEWESYNGNYRFSGSRWVGNRKGYKWKKGYWKHHRNYGDAWVGGKWK